MSPYNYTPVNLNLGRPRSITQSLAALGGPTPSPMGPGLLSQQMPSPPGTPQALAQQRMGARPGPFSYAGLLGRGFDTPQPAPNMYQFQPQFQPGAGGNLNAPVPRFPRTGDAQLDAWLASGNLRSTWEPGRYEQGPSGMWIDTEING